MAAKEQAPAVVIDNGSGMVKAGLAGDDAPRAVFPSIVGRPLNQRVMVGMAQKDTYVGDEAQSKRDNLLLKYPIEHGIVTNWDDIEKIWHHTFYNELKVQPEQHRIMLTESALNSKQNREEMAEILFEKFNVPALYVGIQAVLSLYAHGDITGIVLDAGDGSTCIVPIYQGYALADGIVRSDITGGVLTDQTRKLLDRKGKNKLYFASKKRRAEAQLIKEKLSYVATNHFFAESKRLKESSLSNRDKVFRLPDKTPIYVARDHGCLIGEMLFDPKFVGKDFSTSDGIHDLIYTSIMKCDNNIRRNLFENVVLSGGTTMFPQIDVRLTKELNTLAPKDVKVKIVAPKDRQYSTFKGASMLSSLSTFVPTFITKKEFNHGRGRCQIVFKTMSNISFNNFDNEENNNNNTFKLLKNIGGARLSTTIDN